METMTWRIYKRKWIRIVMCICLFMVTAPVHAQKPVHNYIIRDGNMCIELGKSISEGGLDSFIRQFNLAEIGLKELIKNNIEDSVKKQGWKIEKNNKEMVAISKPLLSSEDMNKVGEDVVLSMARRFPAVGNGITIGYNKFKRNGFDVNDSMVRFFLGDNNNAKQVMLAGSFNGFKPDALAMKKTDSGWFANVKLGPGKYWYKYIVDGNWRIDDNNQLRENDGRGNTNSVYYKTNVRFTLTSLMNTRKLYLAGSFNNWDPNELLMKKTDSGWQLPLYLAEGTYTYRFIADGNWFIDPSNPDKVPNEFGDFNSLIKIGKPYLFRLNGFLEARQVSLIGTFNNWKRKELFMKKTGYGWELPYTLGFGNYEYRFVIDGTEITDPANPAFTGNNREKGNSVLILGANYTFRLRGYENSKKVILAGDFNGFNETAYKMQNKDGTWEYTVYLSPGKHIYKFIVDGKWIIDPANKLWEQNEFGTGNSVVWIETDQ